MHEKAKELYNHIDILIQRFLIIQNEIKGASSELSFQEIKIINNLGKFQPCIMRELSERMKVPMSTMTGIIDKLVEKKYAVRQHSDHDRRIVEVRLSKEGEKIFEIEERNHMQLATVMLDSLSPVEQEQLLSMFKNISQKILSEQ